MLGRVRALARRSELLLLFGAVLLLAAVVRPWWVAPSRVSLDGAVEGQPSRFQAVMQVTAGALGLATLALTLVGRRPALARVAWPVLILFLGMPYLVKTWEPVPSSLATRFIGDADGLIEEVEPQVQVRESLWGLPYKMTFSKQDIQPFGPAISSPEFFQLSNLDVMAEGLAISNDVIRLFGMGWLLGLAGALAIFLGDHLRTRDDLEGRVLGDLKRLSLAGAAALALMAAPLVAANYVLYRAQELAAQGFYTQAIDAYARARRVLPLLERDTWYYRKLGEAYFRLRRSDHPAYHIYAAQQLFEEGRYAESRLELEVAIRIDPDVPIARELLATVLVNLGVEDYNGRRYHSALTNFQEALRLQPLSYKAHFAAMLAYTLIRDPAGMRREAQTVIRFNDFLMFKNISAVSMAYTTLAWAAHFEGDHAAAVRYLEIAIEPDWW